MMNTVKNAFSTFGDRTIDVVDRVGWKRGLAGLAILGAAIGGTILIVRLVRSRSEDESEEMVGAEAGGETGAQASGGGKKRNRKNRRRGQNNVGAGAH